MKSRVFLIVGILAATIGFAVPPAFCRTVLIDRIIARVNEEIITQRQYDDQKGQLRTQLAQQYHGAEIDSRYHAGVENLLRDMIDQDLLVQKAKDLNINADSDVVQRLDQIRKQMGLATIQDLENEVEKQGLIWEDFQDNIRRRLLTQQVIEQEVGSRIMVSRTQALKYFDAHKQEFASPAGDELAEIQISSDKWGSAEADKRAKAALAMLQSGAKWEDVVKKYSDGPNANSGGDVGFFPSGSLMPQIADAIKNLDPGDTSKMISSQYGYVIVKVLQQRSGGTPRFNEVEQQVDNVLYQQKMEPALRQYLTTLRKESYIFLAPGFVDTGAVHPGANGPAQEGE
ncbi:MAG: peptidylprolyl isomerase [Terriglobia bacterium]